MAALAALAVVAVLALAGRLTAASLNRADGTATGRNGTTATVDTEPPPVVASIPVGAGATEVAVAGGSVWARIRSPDMLVRIDPASDRVVAQLALDPFVSFAADREGLWVLAGFNGPKDRLLRLDPVSGRTLAAVPVGGGLAALAADDEAVWVTEQGSGREHPSLLVRVDPRRGRVAARIPLGPDAAPVAVVPDGETVWVIDPDRAVWQVDPATNRVTGTIAYPAGIAAAGGGAAGGSLAAGGGSVAVGFGALWAVDGRRLVRVDRDGSRPVAGVDLPGLDARVYVTAGLGAVWVADTVDQVLLRVDPAAARVTGRAPLPPLAGLAAGEGALWAAGPDSILRIDPARVRG